MARVYVPAGGAGDTRQVLAEGLQLVDAGFDIFPLAPRKKVPLTSNGFKSATQDRSQIVNWWTRYPDANIGISIPSNLLVADVDCFDAINSLRAQGLELPATVKSKTPRGIHLWYALPENFSAHPRVGVVHGMDVRAVGSYVVAPPSINENGIHYSWETKPWESNYAPAPEWLLNLSATESVKRSTIDPGEVLRGINEGSRDITLFRYACKLRAQHLKYDEAKLLVLYAAERCSPPFHYAQALKKLDQAWKYEVPPKIGQQDAFTVWVADEFLRTKFEPTQWIVDQILPEGLTLLASPPKTGKSFLAGNIALAVAMGGGAIGKFDVSKTGVLYIDLEQSEGRAQDRWKQMLDGDNIPDTIKFAFDWPRCNDGCIRRIASALDKYPGIRLVVIDVLSKVWPSSNPTGNNAYHQEYSIMSKLHKFAGDRRISLLVLHHDNKTQNKDPLARVNGSTAMTGVPDVIWSLQRKHGSRLGKLFVTGRSVEMKSINLYWSPPQGWVAE